MICLSITIAFRWWEKNRWNPRKMRWWVKSLPFYSRVLGSQPEKVVNRLDNGLSLRCMERENSINQRHHFQAHKVLSLCSHLRARKVRMSAASRIQIYRRCWFRSEIESFQYFLGHWYCFCQPENKFAGTWKKFSNFACTASRKSRQL